MAGIDQYTKLLLHCDGADGATTFIDSATGKTVTANGHAQIDTAQSKFGGASGLFDGNGDDYLSTPQHADFDLGSGDFTVDAWVRPAGFGGYDTVCMYGTLASRGWSVNVTDTVLKFYYTTNGSTDKGVELTYDFLVNAWYHLAISRTGGKIYFFVNGTLINAGGTSFTDTIYNANTAFVVGRFGDYTVASYSLKGWLDELRISKGIARWTANFTPPTSPYSRLGGFFLFM